MNGKLSGFPATLKRASRALPALFFALALAFSWFTAWFATMNLLDSDTSSELVLANLLAKQNRIMTSDWYYSNELRVIQTQLVYAPLFKLFTNWHTVRFLGVLILQTLLVLSYRYYCKRMGLSLRAFFLSAAILVTPYSVAYGRIVLYHTFYLPFVALGFVLAGMFAAVLRQYDGTESPRRKAIRMAGLLAVSFLAGLNGLRQPMITMVPMLASALWLMLAGTPLREAKREKTANHAVLISLAVAVAGGAGYLVNDRVLSRLYSFRVFSDTALGLINADNLTRLSQGFFAQFGFQAGRLVISTEGLLACGGLLVTFYLIATGVNALRTQTLRDREPVDWGAMMFATSMLTMLALFCFTRENANYLLYLIPVAVWAVALLGRRLDDAATLAPARRALLYTVCAVMLANGVYNNLFFIDPKGKPVDYEGISAPETDTVEGLQGVLHYLEDNHFTLGYATFWNGNVITEMSNGTIAMTNIVLNEDTSTATLYDWLNDKNLRDRAYVEKQKVFVLLKGDEDQAFLNTPLGENANYEYEDENYMIFSYETATEPLDALTAGT